MIVAELVPTEYRALTTAVILVELPVLTTVVIWLLTPALVMNPASLLSCDVPTELRLLGTKALSVAEPAVASAFVAISIMPAALSLADATDVMNPASLLSCDVPTELRLLGTKALSVAEPAVASALVAISIMPAALSLADATDVINPASLLSWLVPTELRLLGTRALSVADPAVASALVAISMMPAALSLAESALSVDVAPLPLIERPAPAMFSVLSSA